MKIKPYKLEHGITQSLLTAFLNCKLRCKLILEGWQTPTPKESLFFGSLFHKLLEEHYTLESEYIVDLGDFLKTENKLYSSITSEIKEKSFAMAEALYEPYTDFWGMKDGQKDWIELEPVFEVLATIPRFSDRKKIPLRGRIDGVFRLKGKLWLLETKTKSQIDEYGLQTQLALDFQNLFYIMVAEELFGEGIAGVLYNVIRKPQLRQKKGEPLEKFAQRMKDDVESRPEHYFKRYEVKYTLRNIKEFRQELQPLLTDYCFWVENGFIPTQKNRTACVGRWNCEFLSACAQGSMAGYIQNRKLFTELE